MDHLITTCKSFGHHSGISYKGKSSGTKLVFVKSGLLTNTIDVSYNKPIVKSVAKKSKPAVQQHVATGKSIKIMSFTILKLKQKVRCCNLRC